ncbi:hypothetical protein EGI15_02845 [Chryseobacterium cucumeris]|uniref:Uncharacterized protein n=1 Tax=Chryseobacterium cucumeris TaxID=1813611 RepID=A0ABX9X971_9FLAO|nr:hypothetical protein EGI15_02845 [Chryseobacterium cucumeris]
MDRGIELTNHLAKDFIKDFNFKNWLRTGTIEHNSLEIHQIAQIEDMKKSIKDLKSFFENTKKN